MGALAKELTHRGRLRSAASTFGEETPTGPTSNTSTEPVASSTSGGETPLSTRSLLLCSSSQRRSTSSRTSAVRFPLSPQRTWLTKTRRPARTIPTLSEGYARQVRLQSVSFVSQETSASTDAPSQRRRQQFRGSLVQLHSQIQAVDGMERNMTLELERFHLGLKGESEAAIARASNSLSSAHFAALLPPTRRCYRLSSWGCSSHH